MRTTTTLAFALLAATVVALRPAPASADTLASMYAPRASDAPWLLSPRPVFPKGGLKVGGAGSLLLVAVGGAPAAFPFLLDGVSVAIATGYLVDGVTYRKPSAVTALLAGGIAASAFGMLATQLLLTETGGVFASQRTARYLFGHGVNAFVVGALVGIAGLAVAANIPGASNQGIGNGAALVGFNLAGVGSVMMLTSHFMRMHHRLPRRIRV